MVFVPTTIPAKPIKMSRLQRKKKQKNEVFSSEEEKNLFCPEKRVYLHPQASMVELVDTHVSGTCAARCAGSSPVRGTTTTPSFETREFFYPPLFLAAQTTPAALFLRPDSPNPGIVPGGNIAPAYPRITPQHWNAGSHPKRIRATFLSGVVADIVKKATFVTLTT